MEQSIRSNVQIQPDRGQEKLLVISSYRRPCGIAQYVEAIEPALRQQAPCSFEIAALPVDLMRSQSPFARKAARKQFDDIVELARKADVVNIQLEPGLYGLTPFDIWRRLKAIINASRRVIITYHTVPPTTAPRFGIRPGQLLDFLRGYRGSYVFKKLFAAVLRNPHKFAHIVQTKREVRNFSYAGIPPETIFDQPLSFVVEAQRNALASKNSREAVARRYGISDGPMIGCFGFLTPYKGIEVAIEALHHLPSDVHLLVAGGLHPEGIAINTVKQPYIKELLELIKGGDQNEGENGAADRKKPAKSVRKRKDLLNRVHFVGALDDAEFLEVLSACDAVVLPYAEVGQTSSGPASMALDLQKPVYCSRNFCFRELDKYQKGILSLFEIGNYVELAQKLMLNDGNLPERVEARRRYVEKFNAESRAGTYWRAFNALAQKVR